MNLREMAGEYRENMMRMEKRIEELEAQLPGAGATRRHKLRLRINRLRDIVYEDMQTILYLEEYYNKDSRRRPPC